MKNESGDISLHNESGLDIPFDIDSVHFIAETVFSGEAKSWDSLEIVFLDEAGITEINKLHLERDYVTDIITYHYQEDDAPIDGTLYMCAQRIAEQSAEFGTETLEEFRRVFIHGMLHLCGYEDHTAEDKLLMTEKENYYLNQI